MSNARPVLPRIAAGDKTAVDECLRRYGGLVWSLARRRCADVQLAEDAVQNIFLHLWKVAGTFDESIANETTFIAMVARRRLIDFQRKLMARKDFALSDFNQYDFDHLQMKSVDPSVGLETSEEAARAEALLNQLPEDQQKVIRMSVFDGLSHSKIADRTGLKLGTVKTHIRRGLTKIRQSLFKENLATDNNASVSASRSPRVNSVIEANNSIDRTPYPLSNKNCPKINHAYCASGKLGGLSSN